MEAIPSARDCNLQNTLSEAEQVAQTRAGFASTSVEDLAREARVTTGALYHHFANKMMLFEAGALTRGAMLIANSPDPAGPRRSVARTMRALLNSLAPRADPGGGR
jgi:AcrR family transcriptional regulator